MSTLKNSDRNNKDLGTDRLSGEERRDQTESQEGRRYLYEIKLLLGAMCPDYAQK